MHQECERIPRRRLWAGILLCLTVLGADAASQKNTSPAANPRELSSKKEDLDDLRQRLDQLKKELATGESARDEAADQLREHEKSISDLQRELHELARSRESHLDRQQELLRQTEQAERRLSQQQGHLDRLLIQQYMTGSPGPLHLLLSGQSPNQTTRDVTYLGLIALARQDVVKDTAALIEQKKRLAEETRLQSEAIAAIEAQQRQQQEKMLAQRQQRQLTLAGISSRLKAQRREIETLRRDEQRLAQLIDRIAKLLAQKAKASKAKPKRPLATAPKKPGERQLAMGPAADVSGRAFAALKGKLPAPASGPIRQKFGALQEGGGRSKGIFIGSSAGSEVRAVADGQVVFADWLRGFGNLVVLDHADGFLSVYGYNEAVLKQVGDEVRSGDRIAAIGNSGGRSETGLYFELRRRGEAIDPGQWLRR